MKIALVGNQNSGKTTLFNDLTGSNQKIGNWPGVTIERKEGYLKADNSVSIVDLPGIYSLSPYSPEEEVSRRFIIDEKPDLVINIVDGTSIERSLYLTTQLLELNVDVVIALNMADILESHGIKIDTKGLEDALGASIVRISAMKETGIDDLVNLILARDYRKNSHIRMYPNDIEKLIEKFEKNHTLENERFSAVKLIEKDKNYKILLSNDDLEDIKILEQKSDMDGEQLIASRRYDFIEKIKSQFVVHKVEKESFTDKLDKVFLNKWLAIPIFILIMGIIYFFSIGIVGGLTTPLIETLFNGTGGEPVEFDILFGTFESNIDFVGIGPWLGGLVEKAGGSAWSVSLVQDGIIAGIGSVLTFLPQIFVIFLYLL